MFEQQLSYRVPGPAQCEAIVLVEVRLVESYLDVFLDKAVHVSRYSAQHRRCCVSLRNPGRGCEEAHIPHFSTTQAVRTSQNS